MSVAAALKVSYLKTNRVSPDLSQKTRTSKSFEMGVAQLLYESFENVFDFFKGIQADDFPFRNK
jgi:hypothetical protein